MAAEAHKCCLKRRSTPSSPLMLAVKASSRLTIETLTMETQSVEGVLAKPNDPRSRLDGKEELDWFEVVVVELGLKLRAAKAQVEGLAEFEVGCGKTRGGGAVWVGDEDVAGNCAGGSYGEELRREKEAARHDSEKAEGGSPYPPLQATALACRRFAWFGRVPQVEGFDQSVSVHIVRILPRVLRGVLSDPA